MPVHVERHFGPLDQLQLVTAADMKAIGNLVRERIYRRTISGLDAAGARAALTARVVRCLVAAIDAERGVTYHAGLAFDDRCSLASERKIQTHPCSLPCQKDAIDARCARSQDGTTSIRNHTQTDDIAVLWKMTNYTPFTLSL